MLLLIGGTGIVAGQEEESLMLASGLFASDSILNLTLVTELESLMGKDEEDPQYQDATLIYGLVDNRQVNMHVEVRARGSFRRKSENCDFPPLKIKFGKGERQGTLFEEMEDVKLVTHCITEMQEFEQYVLEEYLIYKAYNIYTDFSFQVRLARINYVDINAGRDTITRFAFLIEDAQHMADRNNCNLIELKSITTDELDRSHLTLMSLFNYMMLNTDYSIPVVHNIELLLPDHFNPPIPVPYDFDWSGMINIPYESPYAGNKTRYSGRIYKGPCLKRKELEVTFSAMLSKRESLFDLYREFPYLDDDMRSRSLQDLQMFFIIIGSRNLVRQEFLKNCKD